MKSGVHLIRSANRNNTTFKTSYPGFLPENIYQNTLRLVGCTLTTFNPWQIFKNLFEEGLEIQKQRLEELRAYAKEKRAEQKRVHQNELESMENYYKDQVGSTCVSYDLHIIRFSEFVLTPMLFLSFQC